MHTPMCLGARVRGAHTRVCVCASWYSTAFRYRLSTSVLRPSARETLHAACWSQFGTQWSTSANIPHEGTAYAHQGIPASPVLVEPLGRLEAGPIKTKKASIMDTNTCTPLTGRCTQPKLPMCCRQADIRRPPQAAGWTGAGPGGRPRVLLLPGGLCPHGAAEAGQAARLPPHSQG